MDNIVNDNELLQYMTMYKTLCHGPLLTTPVHNIDLCKSYIDLFNDTQESCADICDFVHFCKENNFNTLSDITNVIRNHIRNNAYYISTINDYVNTHKLPETPQISNDMKFVKLDTTKNYLSIDLVHAFSQYVDWLNILPNKFDATLIDSLPYSYLRHLKKLRIFIYTQCEYLYNVTSSFGNDCNHYYNILLPLLDNDCPIMNLIKKYKLSPVSYNMDELIFDVTGYENDFTEFIGDNTIDNTNVHISLFNAHYITYSDPTTDKELYVLIKTDYVTGKTYIANKRCKFINQIYKAYKKLPITDDDLYYINDFNKISKLDKPIKIISIE